MQVLVPGNYVFFVISLVFTVGTECIYSEV